MNKIAFLFPGQGAQYAGMGKALYDAHGIVRDIFDQADTILGESLSKLCFEGPEAELVKTENTQPAILTFSTAVCALLKSKGIHPVAAAGLSLGEYGALIAADALRFVDAVPLVRKRAIFMQQAVPFGQGTMAAILGLDAVKLRECLSQSADLGIVEIANYNCPGQLVISGEVPAVEKACQLAKAAGAKRALMLQVSGPFHSSLLGPAGERLKAELRGITIQNLKFPVISNVLAKVVEDGAQVKDLLVRQVSHSVLWEDSIHELLSIGIDTFIEMGPGKTLTGFIKKINKEAKTYNVEDVASLENTLKELEGILCT